MNKISNKLTKRYLIRTLFTVLCLMGCLYQIITLCIQFFEYPTIVIIEKKSMDNLFIPAITLCNDNRYWDLISIRELTLITSFVRVKKSTFNSSGWDQDFDLKNETHRIVCIFEHDKFYLIFLYSNG